MRLLKMASDNEASCDSDPNFAVICGFLEKFGATCGLSDIDFLDLQEMLENTQEVSKYLVDMHVKLLRKIRKSVNAEKWERSLVKFCHEFSSKDAWEIERFGYKKARLSSKLRVLKELLEMQFDYNTKFKNEINKLSATELRCQPLGRDRNGCVYWFQTDENCQIRVYKEDIDEETWVLIAKDRSELVQLINQLSDNKSSVAASASASASDTVTNEDSTSLEGVEDSRNLKVVNSIQQVDDDQEDNENWDENPDSNSDETIAKLNQNNEVSGDSKTNEFDEDEMMEVDKGNNGENVEEHKQQSDLRQNESDPRKMLTIEVEDGALNKNKQMQNGEMNEAQDLSLTTSEDVNNFGPLKPLINLRIKPIAELLSPNHLEQISIIPIVTERGHARDSSAYVDYTDRKRLNRPAQDPLTYNVDSLTVKKTRPTLLPAKKNSVNYAEVMDDDSVEEPVMYVTGEGSGNDNEGVPDQFMESDRSLVLFGEAIEEPVVYFTGEGNGADCETGNDKKDKSGDDRNTKFEGKFKENDNVMSDTSSKQEFRLGTIYDTKTDKPSNIRVFGKKSRWDVGKPCENLTVKDSSEALEGNKNEGNSESQTKGSCYTENLLTESKSKSVVKEIPHVFKKPVFFFGPGSLNVAPTISSVKPKQKSAQIFSSVESSDKDESFSHSLLQNQSISVADNEVRSEIKSVNDVVTLSATEDSTSANVAEDSVDKASKACSIENNAKQEVISEKSELVPISDNVQKCSTNKEESKDDDNASSGSGGSDVLKIDAESEKDSITCTDSDKVCTNKEENVVKNVHILPETIIESKNDIENTSSTSKIKKYQSITNKPAENKECLSESNEEILTVDSEPVGQNKSKGTIEIQEKIESVGKTINKEPDEEITEKLLEPVNNFNEEKTKETIEIQEKIKSVEKTKNMEPDEKITEKLLEHVKNSNEEIKCGETDQIVQLSDQKDLTITQINKYLIDTNITSVCNKDDSEDVINLENTIVISDEQPISVDESSKESDNEKMLIEVEKSVNLNKDTILVDESSKTCDNEKELEKVEKGVNLNEDGSLISTKKEIDTTHVLSDVEKPTDMSTSTKINTITEEVKKDDENVCVTVVETSEKVENVVLHPNRTQDENSLTDSGICAEENIKSGICTVEKIVSGICTEEKVKEDVPTEVIEEFKPESKEITAFEETKPKIAEIEEKNEEKHVETRQFIKEDYITENEMLVPEQKSDVEIEKLNNLVTNLEVYLDKKDKFQLKTNESMSTETSEIISEKVPDNSASQVKTSESQVCDVKEVAEDTIAANTKLEMCETQSSPNKAKHISVENVESNESLITTPSKKLKLSDKVVFESEVLPKQGKVDEGKMECDVNEMTTSFLPTSAIDEGEGAIRDIENEILPNNVQDEGEQKKDTSGTITVDLTTLNKIKSNQDEGNKEPVNEESCVKKFVPLLTDENNQLSEVTSVNECPIDSDSDGFDNQNTDPLMVSDNEDEMPEENNTTNAAPLTFNSFKLDFNESPPQLSTSPPPARVLTRNRKRTAEESVDLLKESNVGDTKRTKTKGKRSVINKNLRRVVEEQKQTIISSSEEGGNDDEDVEEDAILDEEENETSPKKKLERPKRALRGRGVKTDSPVASSDVNSENSRTDACSTPSSKKKAGRPRKKTLLGLEIPENSPDNNETTGAVRTSRRIAQIKIKEQAERRKMEEIALVEEQEKIKRKPKKDDDKDFKTHQKHQKKTIIAEEDTVMSVESESKKKKKKRKSNMNFSMKLYEANPWKYSSDDSSEEENEEEEEYEEIEQSDEEPLFKSDHEFSPESDLEADGEVQPLKRARTVKKESDVEDIIDDTNCQKCGKSDHPEWILLCDGCDNGWHCSCLRPALFVIPEGDWFCPPCQHISLVESLEKKLIEYDKRLSKREMEVRRKERLAYVGISLDNVLPSKEGADEHHHHHHHHKKVPIEERGSDDESDADGSDRSGFDSSSSSGYSDEPIYQLRQRRQAQTYRFNDYDELINSAIGDEVEPVKVAGNQGRGKDIATIVNANKEEEEKRKLAMQFEERPPVVPVDTGLKKYEDDDDEEVVKPKPKSFRGRKKSRKLNSLEIVSEDSDSDEDFKGSSSADEDEEIDEYYDSDSSSSRKCRAALRRSNRARTSRLDKDFINDDSDSDGSVRVTRKKTRSIWDESEESEESDRSWGRRKKSKKSSFVAHKPKKSRKKKKKDTYDDDVSFRRKSKGFDKDEVDTSRGRRTRGKKINFLEALGSDSEEETYNKKSARKIDESEDEYVANEDEEAVEDSDLEKEEDINEDEVEDELASKIAKKRKNVIEDSDDNSSNDDEDNEEMKQSSKTMESIDGGDDLENIKELDDSRPFKEDSIRNKENNIKAVSSLDSFSPKLENVQVRFQQQPKDVLVKNSEAKSAELSVNSKDQQEMMSWDGDHRHPSARDDRSNSLDDINKNFEDMDEEDMQKMMEEEDFANEQLKLVALQIEKDKQRKKRDKTQATEAEAEQPKTPKKRGRKPKAALSASGGGIISVGPSITANSMLEQKAADDSLHVPPSNILASSSVGLTSAYPTISSLLPQSIITTSVSPAPPSYVSCEPKENEELSEPPGGTIPLFSEISTLNTSGEETPKKRRGRGKGKKTLAKEQAAAAAAAGGHVTNSANNSMMAASDTNSSGSNTPENQRSTSVVQTNYLSKTNNSPILTSKLAVATPPQPFSQSQPVPSVITRMLQQNSPVSNYPPIPPIPASVPAAKMFSGPVAGEPPPPNVVSTTSNVPAPAPPNTVPASLPSRSAVPPSVGSPYQYSNNGQRSGSYTQPPSVPYAVPRAGIIQSAHRVQQQPPSVPPSLYHPHRMDPSPSGGGPINIPCSSQQDRSSPPIVPGTKTDQGHSVPPPATQPYPRPALVHYSVPPTPRFMHGRLPGPGVPPAPFHPPGYQYAGGPPPYPAIPPSEDAQPSEGYQAAPYPEAYPVGDSNNAPITASDNNNSNRAYEEEVSGEFGGLVSYFSSQREDDLET